MLSRIAAATPSASAGMSAAGSTDGNSSIPVRPRSGDASPTAWTYPSSDATVGNGDIWARSKTPSNEQISPAMPGSLPPVHV